MIVVSMSALAVDEPTPKDANTIYNPVFVAADYLTTEGGTVAMTAAYADAVAKKSRTIARQSSCFTEIPPHM